MSRRGGEITNGSNLRYIFRTHSWPTCFRRRSTTTEATGTPLCLVGMCPHVREGRPPLNVGRCRWSEAGFRDLEGGGTCQKCSHVNSCDVGPIQFGKMPCPAVSLVVTDAPFVPILRHAVIRICQYRWPPRSAGRQAWDKSGQHVARDGRKDPGNCSSRRSW